MYEAKVNALMRNTTFYTLNPSFFPPPTQHPLPLSFCSLFPPFSSPPLPYLFLHPCSKQTHNSEASDASPRDNPFNLWPLKSNSSSSTHPLYNITLQPTNTNNSTTQPIVWQTLHRFNEQLLNHPSKILHPTTNLRIINGHSSTSCSSNLPREHNWKLLCIIMRQR